MYIEGNSNSARCFGIVQLFGGFFQFYVPLSNSYTGRDFAALGILDVTTFQEKFQEIERLQLPESPRFMSLADVEYAYSEWGTNFNAQVQAAFGRNELIFGVTPRQSCVLDPLSISSKMNRTIAYLNVRSLHKPNSLSREIATSWRSSIMQTSPWSPLLIFSQSCAGSAGLMEEC